MNLNLSGRPFTNHRLFWIIVTFVSVMSLFSAAWISSAKARAGLMADSAESQLKSLQAEEDARKRELEKKQDQTLQVRLTDQEASELASARILIGRKSVSWSRMLTEIEGYIPRDVKLSSITGETDSEAGTGAIVLELSAVGKSVSLMTETITLIEQSKGRFSVIEANQGSISDKGDYPFTLKVAYRPHAEADGE